MTNLHENIRRALTSEEIKREAVRLGATVCGIADIGRFAAEPPERNPASIEPSAKSVIGIGVAVPRGLPDALGRDVQTELYTDLGVKAIDEANAEVLLLRLGGYIEDAGWEACLQRTTPNLRVKGDKSVNPEVARSLSLDLAEPVAAGKPAPDVLLDFDRAAEYCGLASPARFGGAISPIYGPYIRFCFIVTNAELTPDQPLPAPLCDGCGKCSAACPAVGESGLDTALCRERRAGTRELPPSGYLRCECKRVCAAVCMEHLSSTGAVRPPEKVLLGRTALKEEIRKAALAAGADAVGFAPADRFPDGSPVKKLMPGVKTVVGLLFRVLRGSVAGVTEGTTYYQYPTMGIAVLENTVMPRALLRVSGDIEKLGFLACPQKRLPNIKSSADAAAGPDRELAFGSGRIDDAETALDLRECAVACGLGEIGLSGALIAPGYGPLVRCAFILTDAETEPSPVLKGKLCDGCGKCLSACPGKNTFSDERVTVTAAGTAYETAKRDPFICAAYYNGALREQNPFMPPDAFSGEGELAEALAGRADRSAAQKLLPRLRFTGGNGSWSAMFCGRACDMACIEALTERGLAGTK